MGEQVEKRPHTKKKGLKKEERIHAWISNFTAEHLEEIARLEKRGLLFFSDNL